MTPRNTQFVSVSHSHTHTTSSPTTKRTIFAAINQIKRGPSTRTFNKAADLEVNLSLTELIEIFSAVAVCGGVPGRVAGVAAAEIFLQQLGSTISDEGNVAARPAQHSRTVAEQLRRRLGMPLKSNIPSTLLRVLLLLSPCLPRRAMLR